MWPKALIFDVDGTLAETEMLHLAAFNQAFAAAGLAWHWDSAAYTRLLRTTGGKERMARYWREWGAPADGAGAPPAPDLARLHGEKTAIYTRALATGGLAARPGILDLVAAARAEGLRLAIATTTSPANVEALCQALWHCPADALFAVVAAGDMVAAKKPAPDVYHLALAGLGLDAADCVAIEDSRNGLLAAKAAGLACIVAPSSFTAAEDFGLADLLLPGFEGLSPGVIRAALGNMGGEGRKPGGAKSGPVAIFDLDGTLVDSLPDIHAAASAMLADHGQAPLPLARIRSFIGHGAPALVDRVMAEIGVPPSQAPSWQASFLRHYAAAPSGLGGLFPGTAEALARLARLGFRLALCTNKPAALSLRILEDLGLGGVFGVVIGGDSLAWRKPDPRPLRQALALAGGGPALFIGDSEVDAATARAAGLPFVAFSGGYRQSPLADLGAARVFDQAADLPGIVLDLLAETQGQNFGQNLGQTEGYPLPA